MPGGRIKSSSPVRASSPPPCKSSPIDAQKGQEEHLPSRLESEHRERPEEWLKIGQLDLLFVDSLPGTLESPKHTFHQFTLSGPSKSISTEE